MALFGLPDSVSPEPLLRGDGLYLRPATPARFFLLVAAPGGEPSVS